MTSYRRLYVPNAVYFFTVVANKRKRIFVDDCARICLRNSFRDVQKKHPFSLDAFVLLPDHMHAVWSLPEGDCDYSTRWQLIKKTFSRTYQEQKPLLNIQQTPSGITKKESGIWQRRFWEHLIRDEKDLENHFNYIHYNPVKHGYVSSPKDWAWSSFHKYVKLGWYSNEWGAAEAAYPADCEYGE